MVGVLVLLRVSGLGLYSFVIAVVNDCEEIKSTLQVLFSCLGDFHAAGGKELQYSGISAMSDFLWSKEKQYQLQDKTCL